MKEAVIVADKLTKSFGNKTVVNEVSFEVGRGEIFGFLGPNGSGKSTVIRMLCGLLKPNSGQGFIEGINTIKEADRVRRSVGYMSQKFGLYPDLTAKQNMEFYGRVYGLNDEKLKLRINDLCDRTNLHPYLDNKAETLSGGWKQRLALACSLLHEPSVLFLDEPTAGIDPVARREVWDLLFDLSTEGITMLVTTHYMDEAERCHRVGYIYLSKMIAIGTTEELTRLPNISPQGSKQFVINAETDISATGSSAIMSVYGFLRTLDYVKDVTLFGKSLHCVVPEEMSEAQMVQLISTHTNCKNVEVKLSKPSLEDVFVALTKRQVDEGRDK